MIVIDAPTPFWALYKLLKPLASQRTVDKLIMLSSEQAEEQLIQKLGANVCEVLLPLIKEAS